MELLIVHSETRRGEASGWKDRLFAAGIASDLLALSPAWTVERAETLAVALRTHSHWLLMPSAEDRQHLAFLFAAGFGAGVGERCYVLDSRHYGAGLFHCFDDAGALSDTLMAERRRWEQVLQRRSARDQLAEQGYDISATAFFEAAAMGDVAACRLYMESGMSPDLVDKKGVTVLSRAIRAGHLAVVSLLLDSGADINHRSRDRDNSALMDAAAEGRTEIVVELLTRGADLGGVSRNGQNVLVLAVGKGAEDAAELLLQAGADPFVPDKLGTDAVQYAQLLGRKK
ncbi:MAG TPA: ankyrin repeat domain-containing protein, partial [Polyangiaceae bacterium]|nr:ankyrin repeat domain-containing protein [Polyangiaceae bacterium]